MRAYRKVIAFDSWTEGAANIERLVDAFSLRGLELILIHIGSWGHDLGRPKEEYIGKLLVRDISFYDGLSFDEILKLEHPAAVLFLSTQAFVHRAFNRYSAMLGIPTIHLYHGIIQIQNTSSKKLSTINWKRQLGIIVSRVGKNLRWIWPAYAKALWHTGASFNDWVWFGYNVWLQATGRSYVGIAARDASTMACCVYTDADISHAVARYRIPREAVFAVGNPDLLRFGLREEDIGACLSSNWFPSNEIMYIDTALIEAGAIFNDAHDFVRHLLDTKKVLAGQGFRLVVKLHPAHFRTGVLDLLEQNGIERCANDDFVSRLKNCCAVIVEPSSAALIPALLGLPLLLAQYGKLAKQTYGEVLRSYPQACILDSISDVVSLVHEINEGKKPEAVWKWSRENSGPLPAELMPDRVAEVLENLVLKRRFE